MSYLQYSIAVGVIAAALILAHDTNTDDQFDTLGEQTEKTKPVFLTTLEADQEAAKATKGKYERVKDAEKEVIEYVTPDGVPGYQVIWEDVDGKHSVGYGPEAAARTYFIPTPVIVASST